MSITELLDAKANGVLHMMEIGVLLIEHAGLREQVLAFEPEGKYAEPPHIQTLRFMQAGANALNEDYPIPDHRSDITRR